MKFQIVQHQRGDNMRGMLADGRYVEGYNPICGTSRAKIIMLDGVEFCVSVGTRNIGVWRCDRGIVERASRFWAKRARAIASRTEGEERTCLI